MSDPIPRPCPFCKDTLPALEGDGMGHHWARCQSCHMAGPVRDTGPDAWTAWDALPRREGTQDMRDALHYAERLSRPLVQAFGRALVGHDIRTSMAASQLRGALGKLGIETETGTDGGAS